MFLYTQAVDDWEHYLRVDPQGEWSDDARRRLAALKEKLQQHEKSQSEPLLTPADFAKRGANDAAVDEKVDGQFEDYLNVALTDWLPQAFPLSTAQPSLESQLSLSELARIALEKHGDPWISDFLAAGKHDRDFGGSVRRLAAIHEANAVGAYDKAMTLARKESAHYYEVGNHAGFMQARWEYLYATRLAYRAEECLTLAAKIWTDLQDSPYQWLRARTSLDFSQCAELTNRPKLATSLANTSLGVSKQSRFPDLYLRAVKVFADLALMTNESTLAFGLASQGLSRFWTSSVGYMPGYNLYSCMDDAAEFNQLWTLDAMIIREALKTAQRDSDLGMRAVMRQRLADALLMSGDPDGARHEMEQAKSLLNDVLVDNDRQGKFADITIFLARTDLLQGRASTAFASLQEIRDVVEKLHNSDVSFDFFSTLGQALSALGKSGEAQDALTKSISFAEFGLHTISSEHERLLWSRRSEPAYRGMVRLKLADDPAQAFAWWEWYKGASMRHSKTSFDQRDPTSGLTNYPAAEVLKGLLSNNAVIVSYAVFAEGIAVWVRDENQLQYRWVAVPSRDLDRASRRFLALCSSRDSDLTIMQAVGRDLYSILIEPVEPLLQHHNHVIVEPDGVLDSVPFEAMMRRDGTYLADSFTFSYSPGISYLAASRQVRSFNSQTRVLIAADTGGHSDLHLPGLPDAEAEGRLVASNFATPTLLIGAQTTVSALIHELQDAEVLHFSGHSIVNPEVSGLVVHQEHDRQKSAVLGAADFPPARFGQQG